MRAIRVVGCASMQDLGKRNKMKKREAFANRKEVYQILWLGANLGCAVISGGSNDSALVKNPRGAGG
jgi:hypothetical protein